MSALRGVTWCVLSDFGLQLCLLFLLALCAQQQRQEAERLAAPELPMTLPGLPGKVVKPQSENPPIVVEWDGDRVAVDGRVLGACSDAAVFAAVEQLAKETRGREVLLRIPDGTYTRLRQALGACAVRLEVAGR